MATYHCSLSKKYNADKHDVIGWVVSEKLDGVRALWCPERKGFFSRSNKPLNVPPSWLRAFSEVKVKLDGEFWLGRGRFQECVSAVRKKSPTEEDFEGIKYMIFDAICDGKWQARYNEAGYAIITTAAKGLASGLPHFPVESMEQVNQMYRMTLDAGGEGLMFRNPAAGYEMKRTGNLLKWKDEIDGIADVVGVDEGEGKHSGRAGALVCADLETGVSFRVGTGLTDAEREEWWKYWQGIDDCDVFTPRQIRWRAMERTRDNIPRHPAYVCIYEGD